MDAGSNVTSHTTHSRESAAFIEPPLLSHSAPPHQLEGSYVGPKHKGSLFDVAVVSICSDTRLIVAFEVCCLGTRMNILDAPNAVAFLKHKVHSAGVRLSMTTEVVRTPTADTLLLLLLMLLQVPSNLFL
jgi:hypothetical protein